MEILVENRKKFPTPVNFAPPIKGFHGNWVSALVVKELESCGYQAEKKVDDIFSRLDTIHQRDRQTDGQTDTGRQQRPRLRIVLCSKNYIILINFHLK